MEQNKTVIDYGDGNHPIFKSDSKDDYCGTFLAYCPRCDAVLTKDHQEKCENCGKEIDWS